MLLKDSKNRLSRDLFKVEFGHHMRATLGYSPGYNGSVIESYSQLTKIDLDDIEIAYAGGYPSEAILDDMNLEAANEVREYFVERKSAKT